MFSTGSRARKPRMVWCRDKREFPKIRGYIILGVLVINVLLFRVLH